MKFSYGKAGNEYCLVTECSFYNTKVVYSVEKTVVKIDYNIISKLGVVKKDTLVKFTSDKLIFERGCLNSEDM